MGSAYSASEVIGVLLLLAGMVCVGAWFHDEVPVNPEHLPQFALSLTFLGALLWSIGRSAPRDRG